MSLITVTAPGDIAGIVTAAFNALASIADAIKAVAQDQSTEGRTAAKALNEVFGLPVAVIKWGNKQLGVDPEEPAK